MNSDPSADRSVVLITGISRFPGDQLAAQLAADPAVERIIGIDTAAPRAERTTALGRTEFVRADIRNPLTARVIEQARVTTVVHAALTPRSAAARGSSGRSGAGEVNIIGTMQLLAACQRSDSVRRVVLSSSTAVYGCGPANPAVCTESTPTARVSRGGFVKDAIEVEAYVRGLVRRRPDIETTVLRLAEVLGAGTTLDRYLSQPLVPTLLGFDPRLQVVHESDAIEALRLATVTSRPGVFNVAGDGVITLAQALRRLARVRLPVPAGALAAASRVIGTPAAAQLMAEQPGLLAYGRVVDTAALRRATPQGGFGYRPRWSTAAAVQSLAERVTGAPRPGVAGVGVLARTLAARG